MGLGFAVPQYGSIATTEGFGEVVAGFSRMVEDGGGESLWVGDRLLAAVDPLVGYSGADTVPERFRIALDPVVVLTVAAAATSRVLLGTSVLNLPYYNPALLGRSLATVDIVSGGRVLPGFGSGWSPEEFAAAGAPFEGRGARLDAALDALQRWWTADVVEHEGPGWSIPPSHVLAKPRSARVYLGGFAKGALQRVGRRGAGWLPAMEVGADPVDVRLVLGQRAVVVAAAEEAGQPVDVPTVLRMNPVPGATVASVAEAVRTVRGEGFPDVFVDPQSVTDDPAEFSAWARRLLDVAA